MKAKLGSLLFSVVLSLVLLGSNSVVLANTNIPDFSVCANPSGSIVADYPDGTHGIAGEVGDYVGSDKVYKLEDGNNMQCFCPEDGEGIQTNWLKVTDEETDVDYYKNLGWVYIPNGALWGLDQGPYFAQNTRYLCKSDNGSSDSSSSSSSSSSGDLSSGSGGPGLPGEVSNWLANILSLASTGNNELFYSVGILGVISIALGVYLKKKYS